MNVNGTQSPILYRGQSLTSTLLHAHILQQLRYTMLFLRCLLLRSCYSHILGREIRLQLLKENERESYFIFGCELLERRIFHFFQIKMHFFLTRQDIRLLIDHVLQEVSHDQCSTFVLVSRLEEFVLKLVVFLLESLILDFLLDQVLFMLFQLVLEEIDQLFGRFELVCH